MKVITTLALISSLLTTASAFVGPNRSCQSRKNLVFAETAALEAILSSNYPTFYDILKRNEDLWKKLKDPSVQSYTVFCPSESAMRNLGDKKMVQLKDDRNYETTSKIGLFHVINEAVSADKLFDSAGVISMAGDVVPVERSVSGGFMGLGGKEDGGTTVGGAKVTKTIQVDGDNSGGLIHEVDDLVSPNILWRYMDQLRIPGSM